MKPSITKNRILPNGKPMAFVEVGDVLFFEGTGQQFYEVTEVKNSRSYCGEIDLFELWKETGKLPINLTNNEFQL